MSNTVAAPLGLHSETVSEDWIDYNGHMNVAYYVLIFDHATDAVLAHFGLGDEYRAQTGGSVFVVESHVTYRKEVLAGVRVSVDSLVLDSDSKRLHLFHEMRESGTDIILATNELMIVHVGLATRKVSPFPISALAQIEATEKLHKSLGKPQQSGRKVSMIVEKSPPTPKPL